MEVQSPALASPDSAGPCAWREILEQPPGARAGSKATAQSNAFYANKCDQQ